MKKPFLVKMEDDPDHEVQIPVRAVCKRFVSKDRMVVCWDGTAEWPCEIVAPDGTRSMPMREKGWGVIQPTPGCPGVSSVRMCMLTKPGVSNAQMLSQVDSFAGLIIPSYQQMIGSRYQMVENMLFDEHRF